MPWGIPIVTVVDHAIIAGMPVTRYWFFTIYTRSHVLIVIKIQDIRTNGLFSIFIVDIMYLYCTELNQGPFPSATPRIKFRVRLASLRAIASSELVDCCSSICRKRNTKGMPSSGSSWSNRKVESGNVTSIVLARNFLSLTAVTAPKNPDQPEIWLTGLAFQSHPEWPVDFCQLSGTRWFGDCFWRVHSNPTELHVHEAYAFPNRHVDFHCLM